MAKLATTRFQLLVKGDISEPKTLFFTGKTVLAH
jgi:hypothetical protein